jgi:5-methyltetrahydrofolate--homocysteine methyltransferase
VFYAKDAFEGLDIVDRLTGDSGRRDAFERERRREAEDARELRLRPVVAAPGGGSARSTLAVADVPVPPSFGVRDTGDVDPTLLWPCFDLKSLYRLSWGAGNTKGAQWERLVREEFEPRLARYQHEAAQGGLVAPRAVYGYFPAAGDGDDVILYDPENPHREIGRFAFTRQIGGEHLCLADYVRPPRDGGASDVVALQVVTVGEAPSQRVDELQRAGSYSEAYYLHGFTVQCAEALAEHLHRRVRRELGLPDGRGKRYSWGYGACPDLSQHALVWRVLDAERRLGVSLTEAYQIVPEQSTAAIVIHHPQASYFNAAAVRELVPA